MMRINLINMYLDYLNNYLTQSAWAEANGLTADQASVLLKLARAVYESPHPEA